MTTVRAVSGIAALVLGAAAQADITFSFADPSGGQQVTATANGGGAGVTRVTYDTSAPITFIVDTGAEGGTTFTNARVEFTNFDVGAAVVINNMTFAPVSGTFTFYDFTGGVRTDILRGQSTTGAFVRVGIANAFMFSSANGFLYTAGAALLPVLGAQNLMGQQDAVFSLTNINVQGGGPLIGANGAFNSFTADTSYSGSSQVPAPGSIAILMTAAAASFRRRR